MKIREYQTNLVFLSSAAQCVCVCVGGGSDCGLQNYYISYKSCKMIIKCYSNYSLLQKILCLIMFWKYTYICMSRYVVKIYLDTEFLSQRLYAVSILAYFSKLLITNTAPVFITHNTAWEGLLCHSVFLAISSEVENIHKPELILNI